MAFEAVHYSPKPQHLNKTIFFLHQHLPQSLGQAAKPAFFAYSFWQLHWKSMNLGKSQRHWAGVPTAYSKPTLGMGWRAFLGEFPCTRFQGISHQKRLADERDKFLGSRQASRQGKLKRVQLGILSPCCLGLVPLGLRAVWILCYLDSFAVRTDCGAS